MNDNFLAILTSQRTANPRTSGPHLWPFILLVLILMIAAVAILGTGTPPEDMPPVSSSTPDHEARVYTISYRFGVFSPTNLRIRQGDTVRWRNESSQGIRVVAYLAPGEKNPLFDSVGTIEQNAYFSYVFSTAGVFDYYNAYNELQTGTVIVR